MHHELKIQNWYYISLNSWDKRSEVRFNDRDYQVWDTISFRIIDISSPHPTAWIWNWKITHVLHYPDGLKDWWVVLSLKKI